jgi:branched-chain amino acid transport system substrate-binding protein
MAKRGRVKSVFSFLAVTATFTLALGGGVARSADTGPIKLGLLVPKTGNFAPNGNDELLGWNFALKDLGDTVHGRKIQTIAIDDAGDPTQGLNAARQLVENDRVVGLFGPTTSNEALAIRGYIATAGIPTLTVASADTLATSARANNILLGSYASDTPAMMLGKWVADNLHLKRVTTLALDFSYGWDTVGGFVVALKRGGGGIAKQIWAPITTADWSPYITQIPPDSDGLFVLTAGASSVKVAAAFKEFGLLGKLALLGTATFNDYTVLQQEDQDVAKAAIVAGAYMDGINNPENRRMAAAYKAATGKYPGAYAEAGYTSAKSFILALRQVEGNTTDRRAWVEAVRNAQFEAPRGPVRWDPGTNAPIENFYIGKLQTVNGELRQVPTVTYRNVGPWGILSKESWEKLACCYTRQSP